MMAQGGDIVKSKTGNKVTPGIGPFGVIWDVDGTLVDTAELHYEAWVQLARQLGLPFSRADFTATFGRRNPEILRQLFRSNYSDAEVASLGERKEELYRAAAQSGVQLLPGVRSLLEGLNAAGFKQAIGSSAPRHNLELILRLTATEAFFDVVVAMEDTQRGKPDPQVFLLAASRMGAPPASCLVLEDAVAGVEAAKAGGMKCIAVSAVGHHPPEKLRAAGADLVVPTLEQVSAETIQTALGK
jgi:beta-phosphoglucomutase